MTMKKWRFFPILVKEKIVKYMYIPDVISLAKCSKKCQSLLVSLPIFLPFISIDDRPNYIRRPNSNYDFLFSLDDFPILATSRKFFVYQLKLRITTDEYKHDLKDVIEKLRESQKLLKVKELGIFIEGHHAELITEFLGFCDPSSIKSMKIDGLFSQEIYDEIVKTPQWKSCEQVTLKCKVKNRGDCKCCKMEMLQVDFDDFSHFERVELQIETGIQHAAKLIKNFREASERPSFCQKSMQHDLTRQKVGSWQRENNTSFVIHPTKPDQVFYHKFDITTLIFTCGWTSADDFALR